MRLLIAALSSVPLPCGTSGVALQIAQLADGTPPLLSIPAWLHCVFRSGGSAYWPGAAGLPTEHSPATALALSNNLIDGIRTHPCTRYEGVLQESNPGVSCRSVSPRRSPWRRGHSVVV